MDFVRSVPEPDSIAMIAYWPSFRRRFNWPREVLLPIRSTHKPSFCSVPSGVRNFSSRYSGRLLVVEKSIILVILSIELISSKYKIDLLDGGNGLKIHNRGKKT